MAHRETTHVLIGARALAQITSCIEVVKARHTLRHHAASLSASAKPGRLRCPVTGPRFLYINSAPSYSRRDKVSCAVIKHYSSVLIQKQQA